MTKLTKLTSFLLLSLFAFIIPLSSCNDDGIYFSVDEGQSEGHIKQVIIGSKINVPVGVFVVNVQGAKGSVTATSSDTTIAQVEVEKGYHIPRLTLLLKKTGDVTITVKDEDGNTANLYLTVVQKLE